MLIPGDNLLGNFYEFSPHCNWKNKNKNADGIACKNFSIPFSMEEMFRSLSDISLSDVDPPPILRQRSDFHFLLQQTDWELAQGCFVTWWCNYWCIFAFAFVLPFCLFVISWFCFCEVGVGESDWAFRNVILNFLYWPEVSFFWLIFWFIMCFWWTTIGVNFVTENEIVNFILKRKEKEQPLKKKYLLCITSNIFNVFGKF